MSRFGFITVAQAFAVVSVRVTGERAECETCSRQLTAVGFLSAMPTVPNRHTGTSPDNCHIKSSQILFLGLQPKNSQSKVIVQEQRGMAKFKQSSPDLQCSGGLSPGPFCVEFACSPRVHKGFHYTKNPNRKNMQMNRTLFVGP